MVKVIIVNKKNSKPHLQPTAFNASMRAPWLGLQMWLF